MLRPLGCFAALAMTGWESARVLVKVTITQRAFSKGLRSLPLLARPEILLQLCRFLFQQRPDDFRRALPRAEHEPAG